MNKKINKKMLFHGECVATQIDELPEGLKPLKADTQGYVRIAESEVTGNHHRVLVKDKDIDFYEKDNRFDSFGCYARFRCSSCGFSS